MHNVENNIVFYDGSCVLCSRTVRFLLRLDKKKLLTFSLINGEFIKRMDLLIPSDAGDSILFWDGKSMHHSSDAIIAILETLQMPKVLILFIKLFPKTFRNWVYRIVAKNRYSWFGQNKECFFPGFESRRFLK